MAEERKVSPAALLIPLGAAVAVGIALALVLRKPEEEPPEEPPPGLANVYGKVTDMDTGDPVAGVLVTLNGLQAQTGASGSYQLTNLELLIYSVRFEKEGYQPVTLAVTLAEGNNELNVPMTPVAANYFSLAITNPPSGSAYWVTKWGFLGVNDIWWFYGQMPAPWWLHIAFLDASYQCPPGDPDCEGIDVWFAPVAGHNYYLDCSTGQITEAPPTPPPPPPPPSEPKFIRASYPAQIQRAYIGPDGEPVRPVYQSSITLWLPYPWQGLKPYYYVSLIAQNGDKYPPVILSAGAVPVGYYVEPGSSHHAILTGDGEYTLIDPYVSLGSSNTPGIWPVKGEVFASQIVGDPAAWEFTVPQVRYDLGIIGTVELI